MQRDVEGNLIIEQEEHTIISVLAANDGNSYSVEELIELTGSNYTRVRFFVTELVNADFVTYNRRTAEYSLSHDGRGYLVRNNLI